MNTRVVLTMFLVGLALLFAGCTTPQGPQSLHSTENATLFNATTAINAELSGVRDQNLASTRLLAETGLTGSGAEVILQQKLDTLPWALSSVTISPEGIIVTAIPEHYHGIVGSDVNYQAPVREALVMKVPRVSEVFMMEEGFAGISQSAPVFAKNGSYLGYTDVTYRPETLIGRAVLPVIDWTPYSLWVVQTDGRIIYDVMEEEIGKNLFTDPSYQDPGLKAVLSRIVSEPAGRGTYRYWDQDWEREIEKEAVWGTAGIDGAEWRVVLTLEKGPANAGAVSLGRNASLTEVADLDAYVNEAAAFARAKGRTEALREFNNQKGRFVNGEQYIFAYDMNGTVRALPFQQGLVGVNRLEVQDAHGVAFIKAMRDAATRGGGRVYYVYPNPAAGFTEQLKLSSVVPVDGDWFVGSGIYLSHMEANFTQQEKDALMQRVNAARDFARQVERDTALASFNDLSGKWAPGSDYIFAYAMDGTTLALPHQPDVIGTNRHGFKDHYGVGIIDLEIRVAREGGGFVYIVYLNPDTGYEALKLCYVVPVDDEWLVGSGVYSNTV